jgi:hypothetical protein
LHEKAKVNRLLFKLFNKLLPLGKKSSKGSKSHSPLEDKLHLNPIIYLFYGLIYIVIKGIIDDPIYCDNDDDENSTTTSNSKSQPTGENTSNNTNNTQPESLNSQLGKDTTAVATELGKAFTEVAGKALDKAGKEMTEAVGSAVSQAIGQAGLAGAIAAGMGAGVSVSAGQPLITRAATVSGLGLVGGGAHVVYSAANRSLAQSQGSRNTGSDSTPPSPGLEPSDYPFHSVNESTNSINLETILDNPVQE